MPCMDREDMQRLKSVSSRYFDGLWQIKSNLRLDIWYIIQGNCDFSRGKVNLITHVRLNKLKYLSISDFYNFILHAQCICNFIDPFASSVESVSALLNQKWFNEQPLHCQRMGQNLKS